jgi:hypothetical protein
VVRGSAYPWTAAKAASQISSQFQGTWKLPAESTPCPRGWRRSCKQGELDLCPVLCASCVPAAYTANAPCLECSCTTNTACWNQGPHRAGLVAACSLFPSSFLRSFSTAGPMASGTRQRCFCWIASLMAGSAAVATPSKPYAWQQCITCAAHGNMSVACNHDQVCRPQHARTTAGRPTPQSVTVGLAQHMSARRLDNAAI